MLALRLFSPVLLEHVLRPSCLGMKPAPFTAIFSSFPRYVLDIHMPCLPLVTVFDADVTRTCLIPINAGTAELASM